MSSIEAVVADAFVLETSPCTAVVSALLEVQAKLKNLHADARNPLTNSSYVNLSTVLEVIRPVLTEHSLALVQAPTVTPLGTALVTTLYHSSGEFIRSMTPVNGRKTVKGGDVVLDDNMQGIGAAITYARRYALTAMLGLGQEDDDGNAARGTAAPPRQQRAAPQRPPQAPTPAVPNEVAANIVSDAQKRLVAVMLRAAGFDLTDDAGKADARGFLAFCVGRPKLDSMNDVTKREATTFIDAFGGKDYDPDALKNAVKAWRGPE